MMRIILLGEAEEEMREAAGYYEREARGLGADFLDEVGHAFGRIQEHPHGGAIVRGRVRRWLVRRFPYGILYRVDPDEIVVLAVMHLKRRPGYWRGRR